jgi:hypothetical protein
MEYRDQTSDFLLTPEEQGRYDLPEIVSIVQMHERRQDIKKESEIANALLDDSYSAYMEGGIMGDFDGYAAAQARAEAVAVLLGELDSALFDADEATMQRLQAQFPDLGTAGPTQ